MAEKLSDYEKAIILRYVEDILNTKSYDAVKAWSNLQRYIKQIKHYHETVKEDDTMAL